MKGDISGRRSKALVAIVLTLDVLIAWIWRSMWGPGWSWKQDLLVLGGVALAWSAVAVVFRSRLGVAGGLSLIFWGLLGPVAIIGVILVCTGLFVMAISAAPLFPVPLAIAALVAWGGFLVCLHAAKRVTIALQAQSSDEVVLTDGSANGAN